MTNAPTPSGDSPLVRVVPALFVLLWSTGFIGARLGLPDAPPFVFLLLRFALVIPILGATALLLKAPWPRSMGELARIGLAGSLIHGAYLGGVFLSISLGLPPAVSALIVGLQPLLTALAAGPYLGERLVRRQWLGLLLGFVGVVLVVSEKLALGMGGWGAVAAAVVALLGITVGTLYQKRHATGMHLLSGSCVQFAAAALTLAPFALVFEWNASVHWTPSFVFALLWLVLVLSIGAISLFHLLIRRGAAARVASLFYLAPSATAVFAWLLFAQTMGVVAIVGMVLTAVGVALVTRT